MKNIRVIIDCFKEADSESHMSEMMAESDIDYLKLAKEIESLKKENEKLRECVEFYRDDIEGLVYGIYQDDYGTKAHECLKEIDNE